MLPLTAPGPWRVNLYGFGEMLPRPDNCVTLHPTRTDKWGMPLVHIDCGLGDIEQRMVAQVNADAKEMLELAGCTDIRARNGHGDLRSDSSRYVRRAG